MRYVALLRAINVGKRRVRMERLRELFEQLPLGDVSTYIASGNVLFASDLAAADLEPAIEQHLRAKLGYEVDTFVRTPEELIAAAEHEPFACVASDARRYVGFVRRQPDAAHAQRFAALADGDHLLHLGVREYHWATSIAMGESRVTMARIEKALGQPATMRNRTTVAKLGHLLS